MGAQYLNRFLRDIGSFNLGVAGQGNPLGNNIGGDENGTILRHVFTGKGVDLSGLFEDPMRRSSKKSRVVAAHRRSGADSEVC